MTRFEGCSALPCSVRSQGLRGADYPSSQWFQEGITEQVANLELASSGVIEPDEFYGKLATHVTNYGRLVTPLDAPGTHNGSLLYGGGVWSRALGTR